jgi:hypothetical protein
VSHSLGKEKFPGNPPGNPGNPPPPPPNMLLMS